MADDDDVGEPKYELYVKGSDKPREDGSQKFTGEGRAAYLNGDSYDGTYVEGLRAGKGVYVFKKTGDTYEGRYEENRKHGFGKMTYKSKAGGDDDEDPQDENAPPRGGTCLGNFSAGSRGCLPDEHPDQVPSDGTFTYINGDVYVGQWKAGKKHGMGSYTYAKDNTKLVGQWENGKIISGKWVFPNGTFYSGKFRYNKPFGKGVWVFANGNQLTGDYQQKEQPSDDPPPADDDENVVKPDPQVWCQFKPGACVTVRGGTMFYPKLPS
jgi:radial spoke head protein 1